MIEEPLVKSENRCDMVHQFSNRLSKVTDVERLPEACKSTDTPLAGNQLQNPVLLLDFQAFATYQKFLRSTE